MNRRWKKALSLFLCLAMCLTLFPSYAFADLATPGKVRLQQIDDGLYVEWDVVDGAAGYRLYRKVNGGSWATLDNIEGTDYWDYDVVGGSTYTYTVRCLDEAGAVVSGYDKTGAGIKFIGAPTLTASSNGTAVTVKWNATGASSYVLGRAPENDANALVILTPDPITATSFEDKTFVQGTSYMYMLLCLDSAGETVTSGELLFTPLPTPGKVWLENTADGILVVWDEMDGAAAYRLYRKTNGGSWSALDDIADTGYIDGNVTDGSTYTYTVRCLDEMGNLLSGFDSAGASIVCVKGPEITAITANAASLTVKWTSVQGASRYELYRRTEDTDLALLTTVSGTSYEDKTAQAGVRYWYAVKAVGGLWSGEKDGIYLEVPGKVRLENKLEGIFVSWDEMDGAAGYRLYRKTNGGSWATVLNTPETSYLDANVAVGSTYTYTLRCLDEEGAVISGFDSAGASMERSSYYVPAPGKVRLENTDGGILAVWDAVDGAAGYRLYRKTNGGSWATVLNTEDTEYLDANVAVGSAYTYTARCLDAAGAVVSGFDSAGATITRLTAPAITGVVSNVNGMTLSWSKTNGSSSYLVLRREAGQDIEQAVILGETTGTSYTDNTAVNGVQYFYALQAKNGASLSAPGAERGAVYTFLNAPELLYAESWCEGPDGGAIEFDFIVVEGAADYAVYRKVGSGGWARLADPEFELYPDIEIDDRVVDVMVFEDYSVTPGQTYTYTARCLDADGNLVSGFDSTGVSAIAVQGTVVSGSVGNNGVSLSWSTAKGATKYEIWRAEFDGEDYVNWTKLGETSSTSFVDKTAQIGQYAYEVDCMDNRGEYGGWSTLLELTVCALPQVDTLVNRAGGVEVSWEAMEGAAAYRLYRKSGGGSWVTVVNTEDTLYLDAAVTAGTTYTYTVRCLDEAGNVASGFDGTGKSITFLAAPAITGAASQISGLVLSWSKTNGASSYLVLRREAGEGIEQAVVLGETTGTSYTDNTALRGVEYAYCLQAKKGTSLSAPGADRNAVYTYFSAPELLYAESWGDAGVSFGFVQVEGAQGYAIYRKTGSGGWTRVIDPALTLYPDMPWEDGRELNVLAYLDDNVTAGQTYTYTARCLDAEGNVASGFDSTGVSIVAVADTVLSAVVGNNGVSLSWTASKGAASYEIYRGESSGDGGYTNFVLIATTTGTGYLDADPLPGKSAYGVTCLDRSGNPGGYSQMAEVTRADIPRITSLVNSAGGVLLGWEPMEDAAAFMVFRKSGSGSWVRITVTEDCEWLDETAASGTNYAYTLRALDAQGGYASGYDSNGWSIRYLAAPAVNAVANETGVSLSWAAVTGAQSYRVERSADGDDPVVVSTAAATGYLDADVAHGVDYAYSVYAVNGRDESAPGEAELVYNFFPAPVLVGAFSNGTLEQAGVDVVFAPSEGAEAYVIFRKDGAAAWAQLAVALAEDLPVNEQGKLTYYDETVTAGNRYSYRVACWDPENEQIASAYDAAGVSVTAVADTEIVDLSVLPDGSVGIAWSAAAGAARYEVYRLAPGDEDYQLLGTTTETYYVDTQPAEGVLLYMIACIDDNGNWGGESEPGSTGSVAASALACIRCQEGAVHVSWFAVDDAEAYLILRKLNGSAWTEYAVVSAEDAIVLAPGVLEYVDEDVQPGDVCTYTVQCWSLENEAPTSGYDPTGLSITVMLEPEVAVFVDPLQGVIVSWNQVVGAAGYEVLGGEGEPLCETTETVFVDADGESLNRAYKVACLDANGVSCTVSDTVEIELLSVPALLTLNSCGSPGGMQKQGMEFVFSAVEGAENYGLFRAVDGGEWLPVDSAMFTEVDGTLSYLDQATEAGHVYAYTVYCMNDVGGAASLADAEGLSAMYVGTITGFHYSVEAAGVVMGWDASAGAASYQVSHFDAQAGDYVVIGVTEEPSFTDTEPFAGANAYQIEALDAEGNVGGWSPVYGVTVLVAPEIENIGPFPAALELSWTADEQAAAYQVLRQNADGSWTVLGETEETVYLDETVQSGARYVYALRCLDEGGSCISPIGPAHEAFLFLAPPTVTITSDETALNLSWAAVPGARNYRIERQVDDGEWAELTTVMGGTGYRDTDVSYGKLYSYHVISLCDGFVSAWGTASQVYSNMPAPVMKGLSCRDFDDGYGIDVVFYPVEEAAGYVVYRQVGADDWAVLAKVRAADIDDGGDWLVYQDKPVTPGTRYTYRVACWDPVTDTVVSSFDPEGVSVRSVAKPEITWLGVDPSGTVTIGWSEAAGAAAYAVYHWRPDVPMPDEPIYTSEQAGGYIDVYVMGGVSQYMVVALDDNGNWAAQSEIKVLNYMQPPVLVSAHSEAGLNDQQGPWLSAISLRFSPVEGAPGYIVYRKTVDSAWEVRAKFAADAFGGNEGGGYQFLDGETLCFRDWIVEGGSVYSYRVACWDPEADQVISGYDVNGVNADAVNNTRITSAAVQADGSVALAWYLSDGNCGFEVARLDPQTMQFAVIGQTNENSFIDEQPLDGRNVYKVGCLAADGAWGGQSGTAEITVLPAPTVSAIECDGEGIRVGWLPVEDAAGYAIWRKVEGGEWSLIGTYVPDNDPPEGGAILLSYWDRSDDLSAGTRYSYTVSCWDATNNASTSGYDAVGMSVTFLGRPMALRAVPVPGGLRLEWDAVNGASAYRVTRYNELEGFEPLTTVTDTFFIDFMADEGENRYKIFVLDALGNTVTYSDELNVELLPTPNMISLINQDEEGFAVRWALVEGAEAYAVMRASDLSDRWTTLAIIPADQYAATDEVNGYIDPEQSFGFYLDTDVVEGNYYEYSIACWDSQSGSPVSIFGDYDLGGYFVNSPTFTASLQEEGVALSWTAVQGADFYRLFQYDELGNATLLYAGEDTSFLDEVTEPNRWVNYGLDVYKNKTQWMTSASIAFQYNERCSLPMLTLDEGGIRVTWRTEDNSPNIALLRRVDDEEEWTELWRGNIWDDLEFDLYPSYLDDDVADGHTYHYSLRELDEGLSFFTSKPSEGSAIVYDSTYTTWEINNMGALYVPASWNETFWYEEQAAHWDDQNRGGAYFIRSSEDLGLRITFLRYDESDYYENVLPMPTSLQAFAVTERMQDLLCARIPEFDDEGNYVSSFAYSDGEFSGTRNIYLLQSENAFGCLIVDVSDGLSLPQLPCMVANSWVLSGVNGYSEYGVWQNAEDPNQPSLELGGVTLPHYLANWNQSAIDANHDLLGYAGAYAVYTGDVFDFTGELGEQTITVGLGRFDRSDFAANGMPFPESLEDFAANYDEAFGGGYRWDIYGNYYGEREDDAGNKHYVVFKYADSEYPAYGWIYADVPAGVDFNPAYILSKSWVRPGMVGYALYQDGDNLDPNAIGRVFFPYSGDDNPGWKLVISDYAPTHREISIDLANGATITMVGITQRNYEDAGKQMPASMEDFLRQTWVCDMLERYGVTELTTDALGNIGFSTQAVNTNGETCTVSCAFKYVEGSCGYVMIEQPEGAELECPAYILAESYLFPHVARFSVALLTDSFGLDGQMRLSALNGLREAREHYPEEAISVVYAIPEDDESMTALANELAESKDLVVGPDFLTASAIQAAAEAHPDTAFAMLDDDTLSALPNVTSYCFKDEDLGYLAGYLAGLVTQSNVVGFAPALPSQTGYGAGFITGVKAANPNAEIIQVTIGNFYDDSLGWNVGMEMVRQGADVIYAPAGGAGMGALRAAVAAGANAIGHDEEMFDMGAIASSIKSLYTASYYAVEDALAGEIGGVKRLGLADGAVALSVTEDGRVTEEMFDQLFAAATAVTNGTVTVPQSVDSFAPIPAADFLTIETVRVALLVDAGGVEDGGFNEMAWSGLQALADDGDSFTVDACVSPSEEQNLDKLGELMEQDYDLIIANGFGFADAVGSAAQAHPEQRFALLDDNCGELPNVTSILFDTAPASYLAGLAAGYVSQSKKLGYIQGMASEGLDAYGVSFVAGVLAACPDATVYQVNAQSFGEPARGAAIVNKMVEQGVDVVFAAAGGTGLGAIEACAEAGIWAIGVDSDQYAVAPDHVLCSVIKRLDLAAQDVALSVKNLSYSGGVIVYGVENHGVGLALTGDHIPANVLTQIEAAQNAIANGELEVPTTAAECDAFALVDYNVFLGVQLSAMRLTDPDTDF